MIKIDVINVIWRPGQNLLKDGTLNEQWQFENWIADKFIKNIRAVVEVQYYRDKINMDTVVWPPLSPKYLKWKRKKGFSENIWEMKGETIGNLKYFKRGRRIGYDGRRRHTLTKQPYLKIARWCEYGTIRSVNKEGGGKQRVQVIPPRPLFRMVYKNMRKSIRRLHAQYLKEKLNESLML